MAGRVVPTPKPADDTQALREFAAPTGFIGFAQYQALRRQATRQLLVNSWRDIHGQEQKEPGGEEAPAEG